MQADATSTHDVIVIGSGMAGLASAGLLARAGLSVRVVESQPRPGGYLQGFSRKGFTFDTAIHWLNGMGPHGLSTRVLDAIGPDCPACAPLKQIWRFRGESYDYLLTDRPGDLRDTLIRDFPAEAAGLRRLFEDARELGRRLRLMYSRMRAMETMSTLEKTIYGLKMLAWYLPVRHNLRDPLEPGLGRYVSDPGLLRIFCAEEKLAALMVPLAWAYESDYFAAPQGGSQAFVDWLMQTLANLDVQVDLGRPVSRVTTGDFGRVNGVELSDETRLNARWVVGACDVEQLYERLLPVGAVPDRLIAKLHNADLYYSCVMLFCGLDRPAQDLGLGEEMVRLTRDDVSREAQYSGDVQTTALMVMAPSVRDGSLAPAGKGTLTVQCPAYLADYDRWQTGEGLERGQAYQDHKRQVAQVLLERVERQLVPGLQEHIEKLSIATPVTFWRYTWNREGSIMGAKPTDRNIKARLAHYRSPVPGLLLAGHWAEYGGGVPMAIKSAANVSAMILRCEKPKAFRALRRLMDGRV